MKMKRMWGVWAMVAMFATGFTGAGALSAAEPGPALVEKSAIDKVLSGFVDSTALIGVSALVYEDGKEAYFGAFGLADREAGKPMKRDTIVQIFSMTKPVAGVALMRLYEQGKFKLDDPLAKYAPEFANVRVYTGEDAAGKPVLEAPRRAITVHDMLRHTSGLSGGGGDQTAVGAIYRQIDPSNRNNTLPELVKKLAAVPLAYQPGTRWLYSNAVDVQAFLVEKISGQPFDAYLRQHIFEPLGMKTTRYTILPTDADRPRLAALYERAETGTYQRVPDEQAYAFNGASWPLKPGGFGLVS